MVILLHGALLHHASGTPNKACQMCANLREAVSLQKSSLPLSQAVARKEAIAIQVQHADPS
jgi:hypothetical protein